MQQKLYQWVQHWSKNRALGSQSMDNHDYNIRYIHMVKIGEKIDFTIMKSDNTFRYYFKLKCLI